MQRLFRLVETRASVVLAETGPQGGQGTGARKVNTTNDAENEAPKSRAADVEDSENYAGTD